ncbi:MAG: cell wall-binding repeat-containing protein [Actinomycetaceae bacterium]|nr:cell wall-binding repeat-containing protein [Actinomycetaceae bacterium]
MSTSTVRKFGVGIASLALVAGVTAPAMAADEAPKPLTGGWDRIASPNTVNDRIDTAIEVAKTAYETKAKAQVVYIANSNAMIDAAAAGQLTDGPILLVNSDSRVVEQVKKEIALYTSAKTVYALGGTTVVSDDTLKAIADKKATGRLGGADRYATARAIADRVVSVNPEKGKVVYISRGDVAIDALTAGALDEGPVLLLENGKVPASAKEYLEAKKPTKVIGLGGETVVPNAALSEAQLPGIAVNPGAGYDSYAKAIADFKANRAKYLGHNEYLNDTSVVTSTTNVPGISTDADKVTVAYSSANAADRWMGYKTQADILTKRQKDAVDNAITMLKARGATELFNLQQANGGKVSWTTYSTTANIPELIKVVKALYGVDLSAAGMLDQNQFQRDANGNVTGILWDEFAKKGTYNADLEVAKKAIADFKITKADATLTGATGAAGKSNELVLAPALTSGHLDDVATATVVNPADVALDGTGTVPRVMLVKYTIDELVKIADANAASTKTAMEAAAAKLTGNQKYVRLAGADRYETAVEISKYRRADKGYGGLGKNDVKSDLNKVYVANGVSMVDALVGGVLTNGPILLADEKGNLSDKTKEELRNIGATHTTQRGQMSFVQLIGGKVAVPDSTGVAAAAEVKAGNDSKPAPGKAAATGITNNGSTLAVTLNGSMTVNVNFTGALTGAQYIVTAVDKVSATGTWMPGAIPATLTNAGSAITIPAADAAQQATAGDTYKVTIKVAAPNVADYITTLEVKGA